MILSRRNGARLIRDRRGVVMTEFALILPCMLLLYLCSWQLSEAISCHRKITAASRLAADLITQYVLVTPGEIDSLLNLTAATMSPFSAQRTRARLSMITVDKAGVPRIVWSRANNMAPLSPGSVAALPANLSRTGRTLVHAEVSYRYLPHLPFGAAVPMTLSDDIFMSPRLENDVTCKGCS